MFSGAGKKTRTKNKYKLIGFGSSKALRCKVKNQELLFRQAHDVL
jgi:hypothetical protein